METFNLANKTLITTKVPPLEKKVFENGVMTDKVQAYVHRCIDLEEGKILDIKCTEKYDFPANTQITTENLVVTVYVNQKTGKLGYSISADSLKKSYK